jgi:hypothetical protein
VTTDDPELQRYVAEETALIEGFFLRGIAAAQKSERGGAGSAMPPGADKSARKNLANGTRRPRTSDRVHVNLRVGKR